MLNQSDRQAFPRIGIPSLMFDKNESDIADSILNLRIPHLKYLDFTLKKALYHTIVKVMHQKSLKRQKAARWLGLLEPDSFVL